MLRALVLLGGIMTVWGAIYQEFTKVYSGYEVTSYYETILVRSVNHCSVRCNISTSCITSTFDALTRQCQLSIDTIMSAINTGNPNKKTTTAIQDIQSCLTLPEVPHGTLALVSLTDVEAIAELTCNQNYSKALSSPVPVRCTIGTGWVDIDYVACVLLPAYYGTSFVTAFMDNLNGVPTIQIASSGTANIRVEVPYLDIDQTYTVTANSLELVYSSSLLHGNSGATVQKAVFVTSDVPVMLFSYNKVLYSTDGSVILPRPALGNEYFLAGYSSSYSEDQFVIVGLSDETSVALDYLSYQDETILLNQNQTFYKRATNLTGTRVSASSPVLVLSGNTCARIPEVDGICDYIDEFTPPVQSLGTYHIISFMKPRPDYSISIVATQYQTTLTIYDNLGNILETITDLTKKSTIFRTFKQSMTISLVSNKPVMVHQYGHSTSDGGFGDPSMMFIPDLSFYGAQYEFVIPPGLVLCGLTLVLSDVYSATSLRLNNQYVSLGMPETVLVNVPGAGTYTVLYLDVLVGYNTLTYAPGTAIFGAWVYGRNTFEEFAWCLGFDV